MTQMPKKKVNIPPEPETVGDILRKHGTLIYNLAEDKPSDEELRDELSGYVSPHGNNRRQLLIKFEDCIYAILGDDIMKFILKGGFNYEIKCRFCKAPLNEYKDIHPHIYNGPCEATGYDFFNAYQNIGAKNRSNL